MYSLSEEKDSESACVLLGKRWPHTFPPGPAPAHKVQTRTLKHSAKRAPSLKMLKKSKGVNINNDPKTTPGPSQQLSDHSWCPASLNCHFPENQVTLSVVICTRARVPSRRRSETLAVPTGTSPSAHLLVRTPHVQAFEMGQESAQEIQILCKCVWKHTQWGRGRFSGFLVNLLSMAMAPRVNALGSNIEFTSHTRSNPFSRTFTH